MQAQKERSLSDCLDLSSFKALSTGLGIGAVKPVHSAPTPGVGTTTGLNANAATVAASGLDARAASSLHAPAPQPQAAVVPRQALGRERSKLSKTSLQPKQQHGSAKGAESAVKAPAPQHQPSQTSPDRGLRRRLGWSKLLVAWSFDFLFVVLSLATLLALVTLLASLRAGEAQDLFTLAPVQWLMGIKPLGLVAGIYGLFICYFLLFKLVAGATLGETLLRARVARAP